MTRKEETQPLHPDCSERLISGSHPASEEAQVKGEDLSGIRRKAKITEWLSLKDEPHVVYAIEIEEYRGGGRKKVFRYAEDRMAWYSEDEARAREKVDELNELFSSGRIESERYSYVNRTKVIPST